VNTRHPDAILEGRPTGYNVHTRADIESMLAAMGLASVEELFADVPEQVRLARDLALPPALSELALLRDMRAMSQRNHTTRTHASYLGAGAYEHYIPAVVEAIASRGEFLTAYTPYQPEMSQGLLQALYEFQLLVGRLLGRECVNCSVYDGATALAEACWMMCSATGKRRVLLPAALWDEYQQVLATYLQPRGVRVDYIPVDPSTGLTCLLSLEAALGDGGGGAANDIAGVALQSPNALGVIENVAAAAVLCRAAKVLLCVAVNPLLCGWLEPPGKLGADIVVCEGQPLGLALNGGGPYIGIIACAKPLERYLPGRLVGLVHDLNGMLGYALVKEDREQHVARDKATSHICSNQALNAIRVAVYLAALGEANFKKLARINAGNARYLHQRMLALDGAAGAVVALRTGVFFNEFALALPVPAVQFCERMERRGVFAGVPVPLSLSGHDRGLLVSVTEVKTTADMDAYVASARVCLTGQV
jgi:glycine dehydrogenase subunit 1